MTIVFVRATSPDQAHVPSMPAREQRVDRRATLSARTQEEARPRFGAHFGGTEGSVYNIRT